ncbi:unnamed protein product [Cunninghamella blakesleeana]
MSSNELIIFVPFILCLLAIVFLISVRNSQQHTGTNTNLISLRQSINADEYYNEEEDILEQEEDNEEEDIDSAGEGTSTAVRIKKIGKKKGKKLQRKEEMRQYREYMDQQRELRRAQDEILEEEYKRKKAEEAIQRADEQEKRRKQQEKIAKRQEKEQLAKQKEYEKLVKQKQKLYQKYHSKIKNWVKETKICHLQELAKKIGLSIDDTTEILERLCKEDGEFELSLWSDDKSTFMFVLQEDYQQFIQYMDQHDGKLIVDEVINNPITLFST